MCKVKHEVTDLIDKSMTNTALALDEGELSLKTLRLIDALETACIDAQRDGIFDPDELHGLRKKAASLRSVAREHLLLDAQDYVNSVPITRGIESLSRQNTLLARAAK